MYQEFPKGLSKGDEWLIVHNAEEESIARGEGYKFARDEDEQALPKKRQGRPPKGKE